MKLDVKKIKSATDRFPNLFIFRSPVKIRNYEMAVLRNLVLDNGVVFQGFKESVLKVLRSCVAGVPHFPVRTEYVLLYFTSQNLKEAEGLLGSFVGGRFYLPGHLAHETAVVPEGPFICPEHTKPWKVAVALGGLGVPVHQGVSGLSLSEPYTVFELGDELTPAQCEAAKLLGIRSRKYKLTVAASWSEEGGFALIEPVRPLLRTVAAVELKRNSHHFYGEPDEYVPKRNFNGIKRERPDRIETIKMGEKYEEITID